MISFISLSSYVIKEHLCFAVKNPIECHHFGHILNQEVEIDGQPYKVIAVERFSHMPPYRVGEPIGLMTDLIKG